MSGLEQLSVVIPSWNVRDLLRACLASLAAEREGGAEIVVVDDAGTDTSADMVRAEFPGVRLMENAENRGFAHTVNRGVGASTRPYVLLLNADTEVRPGALLALIDFLGAHPGYGAAAPRLLDPGGAVQRACMNFPGRATPLFFGTPLERWMPRSRELERYFARDLDYDRDADVAQPPAAALCLARETWDEFGGLDEALPLFFNDVDLCRRLADAGRPVRLLTAAEVVHHGGASTRQLTDFAASWHRDRLTYYRKHFGFLAGPWVKGCTTLAWSDAILRSLGRRLRGRPGDALAPLCRSFGSFLIS